MPKPRRDAPSSVEGGAAQAGEDQDSSSPENNDDAPAHLQDDADARSGRSGAASRAIRGPRGGQASSNSNENKGRKRPRLHARQDYGQDSAYGDQDAAPNANSSSISGSASAACDQCRSRKVRCDRQQPDCSNCRKAGIECNQTGNVKRVNHTKQLRDDFSSVLYRLDEIDETLGTLTKLTKQFAACSDSNRIPSRKHFDEQVHSLPILSRPYTASVHKTTGLDNIWPSLVLPSSQQHELAQTGAPGMPVVPRQLHQAGLDTERVELQHGGERTYKHPASMVLLKSLSRRLSQRCQGAANRNSTMDEGRPGDAATQTASTQATIQRELECFPFQGKCVQPVVSSDGRPVVPPPQMIARLFVDGFLRNINSRIPIFDAKGLRDALGIYFSGAPQVSPAFAHEYSSSLSSNSSTPSGEHTMDSPWAIIFTNISLLELGLETHAAGWQGNLAGSASISNSLLAEELISSLIRNCDRALTNLTPYTRPSLLNVQALLTLALVAQEFYGNTVFEEVLYTACRVGRKLGLHMSRSHDPASGEDPAELERVFRVLYGMDKHRVYLTGDPCDLYRFDSDLELWEPRNLQPGEAESPHQKINAAFDDMMMIWEEVYLKLYSARAMAAGPIYSSGQVASLMQLLTRWYEHHREAVNPREPHALGSLNDDDGDFLSAQFELRYCMHVTHVLVLRCEPNMDERAQAQLNHHARACLQVIVEMGKMDDGSGVSVSRQHFKARLASLGRIFTSYPVVAFIDLVAPRMDQYIAAGSDAASSSRDQDTEADLELLRAVIRLLQGLQHPDRPPTYLNRLRLGLDWLVRILDEMRRACAVAPSSRELSVIVPSGPAVGTTTASTDGGGSSATTSGSLLGSHWKHLPTMLQQQQLEPQQQQKHPAALHEMMDLEVTMPPSTQPQMAAFPGLSPGSSELNVEELHTIFGSMDGWPTIPSLDGLGAEGGVQVSQPTTSGGCGFYGLDLWAQDLFAHERSDLE